MSWYYAENNDRRGPLEPAAFDELVRSGAIAPETLVWREGMANWAPLSASGYVPPGVATPAGSPGEEMAMCSESGRIFPRSELVEIDGRLVSAEYKNVVLQRIREGVAGRGPAEDAEAIALRIESEGWSIGVLSCVGRAWTLVRQNFWLCVGATFLVYLLVLAAGVVPFGGVIVQGPLFGGLYWMMLKIIRGEPAAIGDAFQGFSRGWGQLIGAAMIPTLLAMCCVLPGVILLAAGTAGGGNSMLQMIGGALILPGIIAAIYYVIAWVFAVPLVMDKQIPFWPAMQLSRRVVRLHWWSIFGVMLVTGLVLLGAMFVGVLLFALIFAVGVASKDSGITVSLAILMGLLLALALFSLMPLVFSSLAVAYEDIFGARRAA